MATAHGVNGERRAAPFTELLRSLTEDVALLVRREGELALLELKEKSSEIGVGAGFLAGAATAAFFAVAALVAAAILGLAIVLPAWAAALVVAVVLVAVAALLALLGRARLRKAAPLAPTKTIEAVQEDIGWIRHQIDDLHPTTSA